MKRDHPQIVRRFRWSALKAILAMALLYGLGLALYGCATSLGIDL